jgi:hypothetical protein
MKKILFSGFLLVSGISFSQWTTDYNVNTLVADGITSDLQTAGTNDGKTYVVFWDETNGYKLRVQLLNEEGIQQWGNNGILANAIADNSTYTVTRSLAVDAEGNLYIGFTATGDSNGYINKIAPTGEQLFGENGIALPDAWDLKVLPMQDGGVVVGWTESGNAKLMRYDNEGNSVWDAPLGFPSPDAGRPFTGAGEFSALSDGSFIGIFHTKTTGWNIQSIAYAQRYAADGTTIWENPVQISSQVLTSNRRYPILIENDVTYLGYYGSTDWRFDSFIQRIEADGSLPWGTDGTAFSLNDAFLEMETSIAIPEDGEVIWASANLSNTGQSQFGLYVQKFDKSTGERLLGDNAQEVFAVSADNNVQVGELQMAQNRPIFTFSNDISNGVNSIQLGVVVLEEDGTPYYENGYEMIATSTGNKGRNAFTKNVNGQSVAVWAENRNGTTHAYAQNVFVQPEVSGTTDLQNTKHLIYPNPTNGILHIDSKETITKIEVYDLNGRWIQSVKNSNTIQMNSLAKGTYVVTTTDKKGNTQTHKVVKN